MRIGEVFNNNKWDILKDLSLGKFSPLQLAEKYNTTIGNVGHQLKILEAYGLVKREKIPNRNKGKPRTLFSLAYNCAFLASATQGFAEKKFIKLSPYHNTILKLWFIEDPELHYPLEKFYWKIEDNMDHILALSVKVTGQKELEILIITEKKGLLKNKIASKIAINDKSHAVVNFNIKFLNKKDLRKFGSLEDHHIIKDTEDFLTGYKESYEM